jgi:hypothetical protein
MFTLSAWKYAGSAVLCLTLATANAATFKMELIEVLAGSTSGPPSTNLPSGDGLTGTLTGSYDTDTEVFTFDAGTVDMSFDISALPGVGELYTWSITNWVIGGGSTSAAAYECIEGSFGGTVAGHLCANVGDNTDFSIETTTDYSTIPGTRTLGPNDFPLGPQQQLSDLAATTICFDELSCDLVMETPDWNGGVDGAQFIFATTVPIPGALWLFGSALGLLGWMRRKAA